MGGFGGKRFCHGKFPTGFLHPRAPQIQNFKALPVESANQQLKDARAHTHTHLHVCAGSKESLISIRFVEETDVSERAMLELHISRVANCAPFLKLVLVCLLTGILRWGWLAKQGNVVKTHEIPANLFFPHL